MHDLSTMQEMIRQEPVLATLRRSRTEPRSREDRIAQFRAKAEELRAICEDVILPDTRSSLLNLAGTYDRMADTMESVATVS
ncbi:MAG: hypothetical protein JO056_08295 [Alphaproteobacteria bacterium]|nr:hypothetical protein [Alphaproteobacteria bacterium]